MSKEMFDIAFADGNLCIHNTRILASDLADAARIAGMMRGSTERWTEVKVRRDSGSPWKFFRVIGEKCVYWRIEEMP